jgi:hypothetical protein
VRDLMRNMRQNLAGRTERKGGFMDKVKSLVGIN